MLILKPGAKIRDADKRLKFQTNRDTVFSNILINNAYEQYL